MSYGGPCEFCGRTVRTEQAAYPITGWEFVRDQGGANQIHGRKRIPERIAHRSCAQSEIDRERQGIASGQESLL